MAAPALRVTRLDRRRRRTGRFGAHIPGHRIRTRHRAHITTLDLRTALLMRPTRGIRHDRRRTLFGPETRPRIGTTLFVARLIAWRGLRYGRGPWCMAVARPIAFLLAPVLAIPLPARRLPAIARTRRFPASRHPLVTMPAPNPVAIDPDIPDRRGVTPVLDAGRWRLINRYFAIPGGGNDATGQHGRHGQQGNEQALCVHDQGLLWVDAYPINARCGIVTDAAYEVLHLRP